MKANELMIGDWVYRPCCFDQVKEIKQYGIIGLDSLRGLIGFSEIEPIPLTPEILEKNGWRHEFDKTDYMVKYDLGKEGKNCWMMWSIKDHNLDIQRQDEKLDMHNLKVSKVVIPCDYVHQLQQAFRVCGIKKEFEL